MSQEKDNTQCKPLFPIQADITERQAVQCLFPSATKSTTNTPDDDVSDDSNVQQYSSATSDLSLKWLENTSFTSSSYSAYKTLEAQIEEEKNSIEVASLESSDVIKKTETSIKQISKSTIKQRSTCRSLSSSSRDTLSKSKHKKKKSKHKKKEKKDRKRSHSPEFPSDYKKLKNEEIGIDLGPGKVFLEDVPSLLSHKAFRIDRKKDKHLRTYESLAKQHIANYQIPWKSCLGLKAGQKLQWKKESNPEKAKVGVYRYYGKVERKSIVGRGVKVYPNTTDYKNDLQLSRLVLSQDNDVIRNPENPLGVLDTATTSYVQGKGIEPSEADLSMHQDEHLARVAYYNRRLQEEPGNVELWLEFVKFQDKLFEDNSGMIFKSSSSLSLAAIEKRLAILEKALESNPSSLKLKLAQLEISKDVWDEEKINKEWDQLLFVNAGNVTMWRHYLMRQQTDLSVFSVSKIISLYHKCFKMVNSIHEGKVKTSGKSTNLSSDIIELFYQYCRFIQECGHVEKAVASFQALIEFNEYCPQQFLELDLKDRINEFEKFWNSNVPRFGEDNAIGWNNWEINGEKQEFKTTEPNEELEDEIVKSKTKFEAWLIIEEMRASDSWLPWKPDISKGETEEDCKDFERLVISDDVCSVLFKITDKNILLNLIFMLLNLTGLVSEWQTDILGIPLPLFNFNSDFQQLWLLELRQLSLISDFKIKCDIENAWQPSLVQTQLILNILKSAASFFSSNKYFQTMLSLLSIQFEMSKYGSVSLDNMSKSQSKELRKAVKKLLKESSNRNNLVLWNAYAKVELALAKRDDAFNVAETAINMYDPKNSENDEFQMYGLYLICQTYCELLLNFIPSNTDKRKHMPSETNLNTVKTLLKCLSENTKFCPNDQLKLSGSEVLKVKKKFQSIIQCHMIELNTNLTGVKCCYCLSLVQLSAIFEYITSGIKLAVNLLDTVVAACDAISSSEESEQTIRTFKEQLFSYQLHLIKSHMTVNVMSLDLLRTSLNKSLQVFPNQLQFLKLFVELEQRSHMSCRLRKYFDSAFKNLSSPIPVIYAVLSEMCRQCVVEECSGTISDYNVGTETGISNRIRSLFDRGLQNNCVQHCPLVWRLYIAFEVKMGQLDRAKGIFYRSLQQCPSSKVLYKDAVKIFGDSMLQEVVDLMTEKEIRIHLPLEELDILIHSVIL